MEILGKEGMAGSQSKREGMSARERLKARAAPLKEKRAIRLQVQAAGFLGWGEIAEEGD
jgi:hypothetical protein